RHTIINSLYLFSFVYLSYFSFIFALFLFFFNDTATTEIYTLSLHDALPISIPSQLSCDRPSTMVSAWLCLNAVLAAGCGRRCGRSEEHTSELQSLAYLVCRLLLEKKKKKNTIEKTITKTNLLSHSQMINFTV